ncbi:hypothetical protein COO60DRAFT_1640680 [Scenedesmus sp. NREL 46B-D3]|nr:hypothetical protein COO60DRAFT_1640680 [Scenedesmus sp. NREL 46B-D3]
MDASLEMQALPLHDQQDATGPLECPPPQQAVPASRQQPQQQQQWQQMQACSPAPPPSSIFLPPSAVPACGFTADNPFPSRYSPVPQPRGSPALSLSSSPTKVSGIQGPEQRGPGPSVGLPVSGLASSFH